MTNILSKLTIQIDINPLIIGKTHPVDLALIGNSNEILPKILEKIGKTDRSKYKEEITKLKEEWYKLINNEANSKKTPIKAPFIMKVII